MAARLKKAGRRVVLVSAPPLLAALIAIMPARSGDAAPVATTAATTAATTPATSASAAAPRGFVYRVTRAGSQQPGDSKTPGGVRDEGGKVLYLYGTLHIGRGNGAGLDEATQALVLSCQHVAVELDPRDQVGLARALQTYGRYGAGDSLDKHVPPELDARALQVADGLKLARERAEQMRPWMLSNVLSVLSLTRAGLDPRRGSEALLAAEAAKDQADVIEIEGADAQLKLLGQAPEAVQVDALRRTLQQIDTGHIADEASELLAAWEKSDAGAMENVLKDLAREQGAYPQFMTEVLLKKRDKSMADAAVLQMSVPGDTLFAVGALHLFGPEGLIATLRQRGFVVTALTQGSKAS